VHDHSQWFCKITNAQTRVSNKWTNVNVSLALLLPQVSRPGGGFLIAPELIVEHDQQDMEDTLASMPSDLQVRAGKASMSKQRVRTVLSA
jgi:hypothetical protein